jgi:hypothetical protein
VFNALHYINQRVACNCEHGVSDYRCSLSLFRGYLCPYFAGAFITISPVAMKLASVLFGHRHNINHFRRLRQSTHMGQRIRTTASTDSFGPQCCTERTIINLHTARTE